MKNAIKMALHIPLTLQETLTNQDRTIAELEKKYNGACLLRKDHVEERDYKWAEYNTAKDNTEDNTNETSLELYNLKRYAELADERIREDDELIARLDARRENARIARNSMHAAVIKENLEINFGKCVQPALDLAKQIDSTTADYSDTARLTQNFGSDIVNGLSQVRLMLEGLVLTINTELNPAPAPKLPFGHKTVRFLKSTLAEGKFASVGCYSAGEQASFESEVARNLVARGIAEWT